MSAGPAPDAAGTGPGPVAPVRRPWLTRNVAVLCGVSFLQDTASELLYPILPVFLTAVLGAPVAVVGIVEGAADGAAAVAKVAGGRVADRTARRPLIAAGYGLAALGKVLIALAYAWPLVLAARVIDRTGKGVRGAPRDSLLVDGIAGRYRGAVFGLHRAVDTAGAVAGPLLGLALYEVLGHRLRPLFWIAVIPAVASVLLVRAVRDRRPALPAGGRVRPRVPYCDLPGRYWRVLAVLTCFGLVNFPDALLLLRARELGLSTAGVIAAYMVYNTAYAALAYPAGHLSDQLPRRVVYAVGLLFFAAGYLGLAVIRQAWLVFVVLAVYGGFNACTDGVGKAWISTLLPAAAQGTGQGLYQGLTGAAMLIAGVWAGLAWHGTGRLPLLISGAIAALIAAGMLLAPRRTAPATGSHLPDAAVWVTRQRQRRGTSGTPGGTGQGKGLGPAPPFAALLQTVSGDRPRQSVLIQGIGRNPDPPSAVKGGTRQRRRTPRLALRGTGRVASDGSWHR